MKKLEKWMSWFPRSGGNRPKAPQARRAFMTMATLSTLLWRAPVAEAQITASRTTSTGVDRVANLEEQLVNRLRATRAEQRDYIKYIVNLNKESKIELRLINAVERYAIRRNPHYPFPYFERALRYESNKRGVLLYDMNHFGRSRSSSATSSP